MLSRKILLALISVLPQVFPAHGMLLSQTPDGQWQAQVELRSNAIRATLHSYFADIEEDAVLAPFSSSGKRPPSDSTPLEIRGTFSLPSQAVIVGLLMWDGQNILRGKLKPTADARFGYEEIAERQAAPPPDPRDPIALLMVASDSITDTYQLSIYPLRWGESRKIRVRYLMGQQFRNGALGITLPSLFTGNVHRFADRSQIDLVGADSVNSAKLRKNGQIINRDLPVTMYGSLSDGPYEIVETSRRFPRFVAASFDSGSLTGNYLLFWGEVPESLLVSAGLTVEVVFLWRWNNSAAFVQWAGSEKRLSSYGQEAVQQSARIRSAVDNITASTGKAGMVFDCGVTTQNRTFGLGRRGSAQVDSILGFLQTITGDYLLAMVSGSGKPGVPDSAAQPAKKGAEEFAVSFEKALSLYSPHQKIIRHLVIVTAGPRVSFTEDYAYWKYPDSIRNMTISTYGTSEIPAGFWPGVPMRQIATDHAPNPSSQVAGSFMIPYIPEASFSIRISNSQRSYAFDVTGGYTGGLRVYDRFLFCGHSLSPWDTLVEWRAHSRSGVLLGSLKQRPSPLEIRGQDTLTAKLWSGMGTPLSEEYTEGGLGSLFGVVDPYYALLALSEDTLAAAQRDSLARGGLPLLSDAEIFVPQGGVFAAPELQRAAHPGIRGILVDGRSGAVSIRCETGTASGAFVQILDCKGRVIARFPANRTSGSWAVTWNGLNEAGIRVPGGVYFARLTLGSAVFSVRFLKP